MPKHHIKKVIGNIVYFSIIKTYFLELEDGLLLELVNYERDRDKGGVQDE